MAVLDKYFCLYSKQIFLTSSTRSIAQAMWFFWIIRRRHWQNAKPVNCLISRLISSIFHRVWDSNSTSKEWWFSQVISNNIFCWSWQIHIIQNIFTFLQSGNPLIWIIFPDFFSASFQFKSWTFLYFSAPRVSSTRAITF